MLDLVYIIIYSIYKFIMPLIIRLYTTVHSYWEVMHRNSINLKEGKGIYKIIYVYNVYIYNKVIHYISNIHIRTNFEHLQKFHSFLNKNSTCVYLYLAIPISSPHQLIGTFRNELEILGWNVIESLFSPVPEAENVESKTPRMSARCSLN